MNMFSFFDEKIKTMRWFDISLTKASVLFFTLSIAAAFPLLLSWGWEVYLALAFLISLPVILRTFSELWLRIFYPIYFGLIYLLIDYLV